MRPDAEKARMVPLRTCVGCRIKRPQEELVRICVGDKGVPEVDLEKRKPGRGAYLCPRYECWQKGLKKEKLEYSLKARLEPEALKLLQQRKFSFLK